MKFECEWGSVEYVDRYGAIFTSTKNFVLAEDSEIDGKAALVSAFADHLRENHRKRGEITPVYIAVANGKADREFVRCLMNEGFYVPGSFKLNCYI